MSTSYLQSDSAEPAKSELVVVRDNNRLNDLMNWTSKKIRCSKQQFLERVAPQKCARSSDPAFEQLNADFEKERLAYEKYVSLLNEYSLELEALADLEKELCATFGELVPLEIRGLTLQTSRRSSNVTDHTSVPSSKVSHGFSNQQYADTRGAATDIGSSTISVANLDSNKVSLGDTVNEALKKRRANAIRAALYVRAVDCADERLWTLSSVAMVDTANAFAQANDSRLEFDAARNSAASQNTIAVARDHYERAKQDASTKLELLNANKVRSAERALALLNSSSLNFYAAQREGLCATLQRFSVSIPNDLNSLLADRSLLSGVSTHTEPGAVVNVRSLSRSVSMSALQVKTYTRRMKNMIASAKPVPTNQSAQN